MDRPNSLRRLLYGAALALLSAALYLVVTGDRLPPLDQADLLAAQSAWLKHPIADYDLHLAIEGTDLERGLYVIEVRNGTARRGHRDGRAITGSLDAYTVPGLFAVLHTELDLAKQPMRLGAPPGYRVHLLASFDTGRGLPLRYRRVVGGSSRWVEWRIESFAGKDGDRRSPAS